ncbi:MAG TPA: hypothetical protein VGS16_08125 [Candidatus Dormibacteraeota bacterium]|nr:hypothetical protein [Candidatus Dormibacteraeota bacterium]
MTQQGPRGFIYWPTPARIIAVAVGVFYLLVGLWAFLDPSGFYGRVATFQPYNEHFLHDAGAFQVGLGLALVLPAILGRGLRPALLAVLAASLLHFGAHVEDLRLGGHPATDLSVLGVLCLVLAAALVVDTRLPRSSRGKGVDR